jgi:hypothetical protein
VSEFRRGRFSDVFLRLHVCSVAPQTTLYMPLCLLFA